jgi:hypothetical protein
MASELHVDAIKHSGGTSAMTIDSSGRLTTSSNRPHVFCRGFGSVTTDTPTINSQTMDTSWGIHYNADEVTENQGGHYNNSTGLFRVPVTGIYYVTAGYGFKAATNTIGMSIVTGTSSDHGIRGLRENWDQDTDTTGHSSHIGFMKILTAGNDVCVLFRETTYTYPSTTIEHFHFSITHIG